MNHVRFLADGSEAEGEEKQLWNLPLLYTTTAAPKETQLEMMSGETHTLKVSHVSTAVTRVLDSFFVVVAPSIRWR